MVILAPDYGAELPLWGEKSDQLGLTADMLDRIADWQQEFDANFDPFKGWKTEDAKDRWATEGAVIAKSLKEALGGYAAVDPRYVDYLTDSL